MANNMFAYIEKTMPKVIDKVFAKESVTEILMGGNYVNLDFLDARTVKIFKLASTGLTEYQRGGHGSENKTGAASSTTETFTLSQERYSAIPLDKLDSQDDGETVLGALASEHLRVHVIPEFDSYRLSKLAGFTNTTFGNRKEGTIAPNTIIAEFNEAFKWMAEQKVPEGNQIIYVSPEVMLMIRNTTELYKKLSQSEYKENVSFTIERYEGRQIIEVPSDEFFTNIEVGDGYHAGADSKVINFLVVDKKAPIIIKKLDWTKVYSSDETDLGYVGYKFTSLYYHDIFVPDNKKVGIYAHVSETAANTKTSSLLVEAVAGGSQNTKVLSVLTQPAGIMYDSLFVKKTATAPVIGSATRTLTPITLGVDFQPDPSHNFIVAGLDGKVVATSKDFEGNLPKGN